ncbi:MAG TPA: universal stress protein [Acidimicrobiia bacterium]|jgi:nucleotide-binding universal stress UspA family protein|nr:universal stress protein [Acidimicrobiia bacterium]
MSVIVGYMSADRGRAALELGITEAKLRGTDLVVVHSLRGAGVDDDEDVVASDRDLEIIDEELSKEGITYSIHNFVRGNAPAEDIVQAASDLGGEVIVIGLRQRTSAGKFLLGSNAHDILMSAPCPVLTIRV